MSPSIFSAKSSSRQATLPLARRGGALHWLVGASLLAFVSLSLAQIFLIPPGEGFDEEGHYSYVSLLADEGRIPVVGTDSIDASWQKHRQGFPEPYDVLPATMTYRAFFAQPDDVRREALARWYGKPDGPVRYEKGTGTNWEGQHPPLYYALMALVYKLAAGLSIGRRVLWMRLASVVIACSSVIFFRLAWRSAAPETQRRLALGVALAALTPSLVLDVARLGNDALSMALAAALFWQLLALREARRPWLTVAIIGVLLGLGCLTKGYFVVVAPAVLVSVAFFSRRTGWRTILGRCALIALLCIAFAGWWLVRSQRIYGLWVPTIVELQARGMPGQQLAPLALAGQYARGLAVLWATYFYCGTWSLAIVPAGWYLPFGLISVLAVVALAWRFRPALIRSREAAVLFPLLALAAGLLWHLAAFIRLTGVGATGGYYLHIAWPFIALLVGGALVQLRRFWMRALMAALFVGCFVTARVGELAQLLLYGGVAAKDPRGFVEIPAGAGFSGIATALHNLGELVPLNAGLAFYAIGVAAQVAVVVLVCRWLLTQEGPAGLVSSLDV
jgi:4-amino-4-deoxy-L-arabinose transferase-like glycosyltransferase